MNLLPTKNNITDEDFDGAIMESRLLLQQTLENNNYYNYISDIENEAQDFLFVHIKMK